MKLPRVILDTNIIISVLLFGGNLRTVFLKAIKKEIVAVTSIQLLAELSDILSKKFIFSQEKITLTERKIRKKFVIVYPKKTINVLKDDPDNRVLEAAMEGNCGLVITGDKPLLTLTKYRNIRIVTIKEFLSLI